MNTEQLRQRKQELEKQRDQFVQQANMEISGINGRIAQIDELLALLEEGEPETDIAILNGRKHGKEKAAA